MNGGEAERWSVVAAEWSRLWGDHPEPAWREMLAAADLREGQRLLDVGCGSGELLAFVASAGAVVAGCDPATGMLEAARTRVPSADLRDGGWDHLPWDDGEFDVVVAVNALQFAEDPDAALAEARRVVSPGGRIAIANWAEAALNDIERIEAALAAADGEEALPDDETRLPGGLERMLTGAGLVDVRSGLVEAVWLPTADDDLVRGVLLGEDEAGLAERGPEVVAAAAPFRRSDGGYRIVDGFRWAIGTVPA